MPYGGASVTVRNIAKRRSPALAFVPLADAVGERQDQHRRRHQPAAQAHARFEGADDSLHGRFPVRMKFKYTESAGIIDAFAPAAAPRGGEGGRRCTGRANWTSSGGA